MPLDFTETTITAAVQETFAGAKDERTQTLFVELVRHLHDLAREVRLTGDEWFTAVDFLERVGQISGPTRQEVVLLSDILGLSVLVDQINHANAGSTTDSTLLGPFYVEGRPRVDNGSDISGGVSGVPLFFSGTVRDTDGKPISGVHWTLGEPLPAAVLHRLGVSVGELEELERAGLLASEMIGHRVQIRLVHPLLVRRCARRLLVCARSRHGGSWRMRSRRWRVEGRDGVPGSLPGGSRPASSVTRRC